MDSKEQKELAVVQVNILIGLTISIFSSLFGPLSSGHFTFISFIVSLFTSGVLSILIAIFVPIKKISDSCVSKMQPESIGRKCVEALIYDLLFTLVVNILMVAMAYRSARANGADVRFLPMFARNFSISLIVGFILVIVCKPLYEKLFVPKDKVD